MKKQHKTKARVRSITIEQAALWQNYVTAKHALITSGLIRSYKSTEADLSGWLVAFFLGGTLAKSQAQKAYDVTAGRKRIQVRSYTKMPSNPNGYGIRQKDRSNNPKTGATHYAFVCFNRLVPDAIFLVPESYVRTFRKRQLKRRDLEDTPHKLKIDLRPFQFPNEA